MKYYTLKDRSNQIRTISEKGLTGLIGTGITALDVLIKLKLGFPVFIAGQPFHGKSQFVIELIVNLSKLHGYKHFIYFGEAGDPEYILLEIIHAFLGKKYEHANESERIYAEQFVNEHFIIANTDRDYTIDDFHKLVEEAEKELGIKFQTTVFDPINDVIEEVDKFGGREDKYLAHALKKVRVSSKKNNRIDILVNHIADIKIMTNKDGNRYAPPALPTEWAGGKTWHRRAFTMLLVYRLPVFLNDANGQPYKENETHIYVQKIKPKGLGSLGVARIFWDWKKNQYYSYASSGQLLYSCEKLEDLQPKKGEALCN
jgi:KaiC/GvpD/RAD55 family RecA-like ATPase